MKTALHHAEISPRKFPSQKLWIYLALHIFIGQLISFASLGEYKLAHSLFVSVDAVLPTFRTWFVQSKDPIGCKVLLLLWWLVFVPWGLIWFGRFSKGFSVLNKQVFAGAWSKTKWLTIGLFFSALFAYGHSFMDHAENLALGSLKSGLSSVIPFLINHGPGYFAIYLAGASLLTVIACSLVLMVMRELLTK